MAMRPENVKLLRFENHVALRSSEEREQLSLLLRMTPFRAEMFCDFSFVEAGAVQQ